MELPTVGQARLLADLFGEALERHAPSSVALLGCAGGNGLERVRGTAVRRVECVDINPRFVEETRARFSGRVDILGLHAGDLERDAFSFEPVDLAFAGLLFEYVDPFRLLSRLRGMIQPGGVLTAVLQVAGAAEGEITPSPYASLAPLAAVLRPVPPEEMAGMAAEAGFLLEEMRLAVASGGKRFCAMSFRNEAADLSGGTRA